jgi:hypothetical protein
MAEETAVLTIRFAGTCCFIDGDKSKRVVLPNDTLQSDSTQSEIQRHIGYVEFRAEDIDPDQQSDGLSAPYKHDHSEVEYRRFDLTGHEITIESVVPSDDGLIVANSYKRYVSKMSKVHPGLYSPPRRECFDSPPDPLLICGAINITDGVLSAGKLYPFITQFKNSTTTTLTLQTSEYVDVNLPIESGEIIITFTDRNGSSQVFLLPKAGLITIGNQPLDDILEKGSGDDVTHHFKLYYGLAKPGTVMQDPPLPQKTRDPVNSCTVTGWP